MKRELLEDAIRSVKASQRNLRVTRTFLRSVEAELEAQLENVKPEDESHG